MGSPATDGQATDPRLPLRVRTAADTEGDVQRILEKLDRSGVNKRIIRVLANSPTAFRPFVLLSTQLLTSAYFPRLVQEIVILHLAARRQTHYEWAEHVPMGLESGVSGDQIAAIDRDGGAIDTSVFSDEQLLAVATADEILQGRSLRVEQWAAAVGRWGEAGAMDLLWTVSVWGALVPTMIEAIGLRNPEGAAVPGD